MAEAVQVEMDEGELAVGAVERTTLTLRIHNCAVREIAERFPEACAVEAKFVERLLGVPLVRNAHRRDGCGRCEYGVTGHLSTVKQEQA
jgi:DeoR family transcriptional regulator, suf operon transcriptional repressor